MTSCTAPTLTRVQRRTPYLAATAKTRRLLYIGMITLQIIIIYAIFGLAVVTPSVADSGRRGVLYARGMAEGDAVYAEWERDGGLAE